MRILNIDIETRSDVDLKSCGLYKYCASKHFEILMIGYSFDGEPVQLYELSELPNEFGQWLKDPTIKKTAWNAAFEIHCLNRYHELETDTSQWECTMVKATMLGFPASLDLAGKVINVADKKSATGKALIKFFSVPRKADGKFNNPNHYPEKWQAFKDYCVFDVKVEQQIAQKFEWFNIIDRERSIWLLDQKINKLGIRLDNKLVENAVQIKDALQVRLMQEAREITGLDNPNSLKQLKEWVERETGSSIISLTKENLAKLIEDYPEPHINRMLCIRQELSKTSNEKYEAMRSYMAADHRARFLLQYYGAGKTGRWAGRGIQVQNLTHTKLKTLDLAREMVLAGDLDSLDILYPNVSNVLSQLIRTAFIADEGHELLVSDFSAIEARVTAWFANEEWRLEVFRGHGKIYEASGAQMFKIPIETVVGDIRAKSKVAELALGFQGGYNAMVKMGAHKMGIADDEIQPIVDLWRQTSPRIVKLWYNIDRCAISAVDNPGAVYQTNYLKFQVKNDILFIQLPSGRCLSYPRPRLKTNKFDKECVSFEGINQLNQQWCKLETYGGKLTENIVQGTARDLLADAMMRLDKHDIPIVMHVHDEVVANVPIAEKVQILKKAGEIMGQEIPWAKGLPLAAASFTTPYYIKD